MEGSSRLPPVKLTTVFIAWDKCAVCGRQWDNDHPVPTYYTLDTIDSPTHPPVPVCDYCIEENDPALFEALLADRRRFYAS